MLHYRTLVGELGLALILLVGLLVAGASPLAAGVYTIFAVSVAGLGAWLAGKSAMQHLGNGDGTGGAWKNLTTSSKPGEAEPARPGGYVPEPDGSVRPSPNPAPPTPPVQP